MKERFKKYLEEQFRQIAPTKLAMEYRIETLNKMLDRAQDLRIKGMNDDELIYNTVISELGDFTATLRGYENNVVKKEVGRRIATLGAFIGVAFVVALILSYVIVGCVAHIWHPTWLIIVGGILLGVIVLIVMSAVRLAKNKAFLAMRALIVGAEVIACVVIFLFLQLVGQVNGSYMTFLAMVACVTIVDTVISFITKSKFRWIELPICAETASVMLYVILGISLGHSGINIWHPGWLMCLTGAVVAFAEGIAVLIRRVKAKKTEEKLENSVVDESYWTKWE